MPTTLPGGLPGSLQDNSAQTGSSHSMGPHLAPISSISIFTAC